MGNGNIFVANLCEEIGKVYLTSDINGYPKYYEGTTHLLLAHEIYKYHKDGFFDDYTTNLKNLSKNYIKLGNYKLGLEFGYELILAFMKIIINNNPQQSDKSRENVKYKIKGILINLIMICKSLEESDKVS